MLLHIGDGKPLLLSIPRDSLVADPGPRHHQDQRRLRVRRSEAAGADLEQNTGVRIDHYVEIGFGGFVNAVDAVGGITDLPDPADGRPEGRPERSRRAARRSTASPRSATPAPGTPTPLSVTSPAPSTSARWSARSATEVKSPWSFLNPFRYSRLNKAATTRSRSARAPGCRHGQVRAGDDQGQRQGRADLLDADPRPRRALGPGARAGADAADQGRPTDDIPKRLCLPTGLESTLSLTTSRRCAVTVDDDGIATLLLNRPDALNSFTVTMARELEQFFLDRATDDDDPRGRGHRRRPGVLRRHGPVRRGQRLRARRDARTRRRRTCATGSPRSRSRPASATPAARSPWRSTTCPSR